MDGASSLTVGVRGENMCKLPWKLCKLPWKEACITFMRVSSASPSINVDSASTEARGSFRGSSGSLRVTDVILHRIVESSHYFHKSFYFHRRWKLEATVEFNSGRFRGIALGMRVDVPYEWQWWQCKLQRKLPMSCTCF